MLFIWCMFKILVKIAYVMHRGSRNDCGIKSASLLQISQARLYEVWPSAGATPGWHGHEPWPIIAWKNLSLFWSLESDSKVHHKQTWICNVGYRWAKPLGIPSVIWFPLGNWLCFCILRSKTVCIYISQDASSVDAHCWLFCCFVVIR